jgi:serine/threonine-protein kinase RsbW
MAEPPERPAAASVAAGPESMRYSRPGDLSGVRSFVRARASALGLSDVRADLLTLAVSELATNTLQHTGDGGRVRIWAEAGDVVCDVVDSGLGSSLGHGMPSADAVRGRGLAIVERICDDVSAWTAADGSVVRVRLAL